MLATAAHPDSAIIIANGAQFAAGVSPSDFPGVAEHSGILDAGLVVFHQAWQKLGSLGNSCSAAALYLFLVLLPAVIWQLLQRCMFVPDTKQHQRRDKLVATAASIPHSPCGACAAVAEAVDSLPLHVQLLQQQPPPKAQISSKLEPWTKQPGMPPARPDSPSRIASAWELFSINPNSDVEPMAHSAHMGQPAVPVTPTPGQMARLLCTTVDIPHPAGAAPAAAAEAAVAQFKGSSLYCSSVQHLLLSTKMPMHAAVAVAGIQDNLSGDEQLAAVQLYMQAQAQEAVSSYMQAQGGSLQPRPLVVHCAAFYGCVQVVVWVAAPAAPPAAVAEVAAAAAAADPAGGDGAVQLNTALPVWAAAIQRQLVQQVPQGRVQLETTHVALQPLLQPYALPWPADTTAAVPGGQAAAAGHPGAAASCLPAELQAGCVDQEQGGSPDAAENEGHTLHLMLPKQLVTQLANTGVERLRVVITSQQQPLALVDMCWQLQELMSSEAPSTAAVVLSAMLPAAQLAQVAAAAAGCSASSSHLCVLLLAEDTSSHHHHLDGNPGEAAPQGTPSAAGEAAPQGTPSAAAAAAVLHANSSSSSSSNGDSIGAPVDAVFPGTPTANKHAGHSHLLRMFPLLLVPAAASTELAQLMPHMLSSMLSEEAAAAAAGSQQDAALLEKGNCSTEEALQGCSSVSGVPGLSSQSFAQLGAAFNCGVLPLLQDMVLAQQMQQQVQQGLVPAQWELLVSDLTSYFEASHMLACRQLCAAAGVDQASSGTVQQQQLQESGPGKALLLTSGSLEGKGGSSAVPSGAASNKHALTAAAAAAAGGGEAAGTLPPVGVLEWWHLLFGFGRADLEAKFCAWRHVQVRQVDFGAAVLFVVSAMCKLLEVGSPLRAWPRAGVPQQQQAAPPAREGLLGAAALTATYLSMLAVGHVVVALLPMVARLRGSHVPVACRRGAVFAAAQVAATAYCAWVHHVYPPATLEQLHNSCRSFPLVLVLTHVICPLLTCCGFLGSCVLVGARSFEHPVLLLRRAECPGRRVVLAAQVLFGALHLVLAAALDGRLRHKFLQQQRQQQGPGVGGSSAAAAVPAASAAAKLLSKVD